MAPSNEDPKLIIRVITLELTHHRRPRYHNVTDRLIDGRATYDSKTALAQRYVLRAVKRIDRPTTPIADAWF